MSHLLGLAIEGLVAVLLILTIAYCMLLNKRLQRLRADEHALRATIGELLTATEIAERAIAGLKLTVRDCDSTLGERLREADAFTTLIERRIGEGDAIVEKLGRIISAARASEPQAPEQPQPTPARAVPMDPRETLIAAQAFLDRTRARMDGIAA